MKYKALLTGKSNSIIDDFFVQLKDSFEAVTSSNRYDDILRHLKFFEPDVFIYCMNNESVDNIKQMTGVKQQLNRSHIPFVLTGAKEDCDEFAKLAVNVTDIVLTKPLTAETIEKKLMPFLDGYWERQKKADEIKEKLKSNLSILDEKLGFDVPPSAENAVSVENVAPAENAAPVQNMPSTENAAPAQSAAVKEDKSWRKHILVVDDDPLMLKMLKEHLHKKYDVATAISGKIAMKFLERRKTDLILLDYNMPGENGPAVLEKLRANKETKDLPVVFLTGVTEKEKIQEALALKPQNYLLKPVDRDRLMEVIAQIIG